MSVGMDKVKYLYQARRVATQANVAGGAVKVDITVASGQVAKIVWASALNSGNNSIAMAINDEDNARTVYLGGTGAAATIDVHLPQTPASAATALVDGSAATSVGGLIGPGSSLSFEQGAAGAQNDTITVAVVLLLSTSTAPTWSVARSTNAGDVTLAASTISAANTTQAVVM